MSDHPRRPGRPRGNAQRWNVNLWIRPEERERIEQAAREAGVSTAAYVVGAALDRAREQVAAAERMLARCLGEPSGEE